MSHRRLRWTSTSPRTLICSALDVMSRLLKDTVRSTSTSRTVKRPQSSSHLEKLAPATLLLSILANVHLLFLNLLLLLQLQAQCVP